jgi:hypothetical protein
MESRSANDIAIIRFAFRQKQAAGSRRGWKNHFISCVIQDKCLLRAKSDKLFGFLARCSPGSVSKPIAKTDRQDTVWGN